MKQYLLRMPLLLLFAALAVDASAARQTPTTGRVVDPDGTAVAYATVVLLDAETQLAGTATAADGSFSLKVPAGRYRLTIQYLGYETLTRDVDTPGDLGEFVLHPASVEMQEVVVKTSLVRREADRFVMEIAGSPVALGKDGTELLKQAPGVWLTDDKIAINGASGVKVYINDREVRMSTEQLANYLRGLKSEEIQRIEVIPQAGADYDADSAAGIIRITLRRQRDNGLTGDLSFSTRQSRQIEGYNPSLSLNGHAGRWTFNASGWASVVPPHVTKTAEHTEYRAGGALLDASSEMRGRDNCGGGRAGAIFDISERHSIGAEADFYIDRDRSPNRSSTDFREAERLTRNESLYDGSSASIPSRPPSTTSGASTRSARRSKSWPITAVTTAATATTVSSARPPPASCATRPTTTARGDFTTWRRSTPHSKSGSARRGSCAPARSTPTTTCTTKRSTATSAPRGWETLDAYSYVTDYTEHITAAYAAATLKKGHWNVVAGLRGEYTRTTGYGSDVRQRYFSLFPNANLTYAFDAAGLWSLTAQYARNISRPGFWALNPMRMQISDYTYQSGNPDLLPAYTDNLSLTAVFAGKYSLSAGAQLHHDEIAQVFGSDAADASITNLRFENLDRTEQYFAAANIPPATHEVVDAQRQPHGHLPPRPHHRRRTAANDVGRLRQRRDDLHAAAQVLHRSRILRHEPLPAGQPRHEELPQRDAELQKTPAGQPSDTHGAGSEPLRPFAAVRGRDRNLRTRPAGIQRLAAPPLRTDGQLQLQDRQVVQGPQGRERRRRRKRDGCKEADIGNRNCTGVFLKSSVCRFPADSVRDRRKIPPRS